VIAACFVLTAVCNAHQNNKTMENPVKTMFCRACLNSLIYKIDKKIAFLYLVGYNHNYEKGKEE